MDMTNLSISREGNGTKTTSLPRITAGPIIGLLLALCPCLAHATTHTVTVGAGGLKFTPSSLVIPVGDTVQWTWSGNFHSRTSGAPGAPTGFWDSGVRNQGATFSHIFNAAGSFPYYCSVHGACCSIPTD